MRATSQHVETGGRVVALLTATHNEDLETTSTLMRELTVKTASQVISVMLGMLLGAIQQLADDADITVDEWLISFAASVAAAEGREFG